MANLPTENNNPGDLRDVGQQGASQGAGGFASFQSPQAGYGALLNDLQTKINNKPNETLADFSNVYAPPSDNNNSAQYTANLANQLDVAPNTPIGSLEPNIGKFAEAIANNEGYETSADDSSGIGSGQDTTPQSSATSFSPADIGLGLVGMAGSALGGLWGMAQKPLTDAAVDAGVGAAVGAPEGGVGAIPGALAGAATGLVEGGIQDITGGSNNSIPASDDSQTSQEQASEPTGPGPTSAVPTEAQTLINSATQGELNRTVGGRNLSQSQEGQIGTATMSENGYVPENNNGNADYSAGIAHSQQSEKQAAEIEQQAAAGSVVPMSEVLATAQKNIKNSNVAPDIKQKTLDSLGQISSSYGDGDISGSDAIQARHQQYAAVKKDWSKMASPEIEARKALGTAFRDTALAHSNNHDLQRAAIFEQQKHISAQKVMKKLHNHPLSKKFLHPVRKELFRMAAQMAEAYIGDKIGGPVGSVLGYAIGSRINSSLEKKLKKTNFDTPEMKKALTVLHDTKPGAYNHFKETLKRNKIEIPDISEKPSNSAKEEKQVEKNVQPLEKEVKKDTSKIQGKSKGFPAHETKARPSEALKALMQRNNPPSKALTQLKKGLPLNERKGQMRGLVSLKR